MEIWIANESTALSDGKIEQWMPGFQAYASEVAQFWPRRSNLKFGSLDAIPSNAWQILLLDTSDQANALGYHDYTPGGKPISKVFVGDDIKYGYNPTVTLTHELSEMIADPWISEVFQISDTKFYAKEVADPVEADRLAYESHIVPGLLVSDFVTPAWFIPGHPGPIYDRNRQTTMPLQILQGGYMSVFESGSGWTQIDAQHFEVPMDVKGKHSRPNRYARPRG